MYKGAFQIARKLFEDELWLKKPASWKVIWIYIIGRVNHKKENGFDRGEGYFNFADEKRRIGYDITENQIKRFCQYARASSMISTSRSTRGMRIKVLKYDLYQGLTNYSSTSQSTREAREKHERSTPINKNDKNVKNDKNTEGLPCNPDIPKVINLFKGISPTNYKKWYGNVSYRAATERLLKLYPYERLEKLIENVLPVINSTPYVPKDCKAFNPYELEKNIDKIITKIKELQIKGQDKQLKVYDIPPTTI